MKFCLDVSSLASKTPTGIQTYTTALLKEFTSGAFPNLDFQTACKISRLKKLPPLESRPRWITKLFDRFTFRDIDVFHGPDFYLPRLSRRTRSLVTIHDLVVFSHPEFMSSEWAALMQKKINRLFAESKPSAILAVSEFSKTEIEKFFPDYDGQIFVVPEACDADVFYPRPLSEIEATKSRHGLDQPYILFSGTLEIRKNLHRLAEAFAQTMNKHHFDLVLIGRASYRFDELEAVIARLGIKPRVKLLGYVPQDDLPRLMSGSAFFIYPSLYEGFGLPILEAMQCGKAVITSNCGAMAEVAGDAALLVSPTSVNDLAAALLQLIEDESYRKTLEQKSIKRAAHFSWHETARQTYAVYQQLLTKSYH
jgi:glycosyltransferase involved in cell wall biosynthesis